MEFYEYWGKERHLQMHDVNSNSAPSLAVIVRKETVALFPQPKVSHYFGPHREHQE